MKLTYKEIKTELKRRRENTRYFNQAFYKLFREALRNMEKNIEFGVDDSYIRDGVRLFRAYDEIYKSDFYNKNSACYCEFLAIQCGAELV